MNDNPYESPSPLPPGLARDDPARQVAGPAIALVAVGLFALVFTVLSLGFDLFLLASGTADRFGAPALGIDGQTKVTIRTTWGAALLVSNIVVVLGGLSMKRLRNRGLALTAAVLAVIPCVGPCYLLGIPFGIWALLVLSRPEVKEAFR